jgi:hypothetical protein
MQNGLSGIIIVRTKFENVCAKKSVKKKQVFSKNNWIDN